MGTPLRSGRLFTAADIQNGATQVAIVNETLAGKYWPNQDLPLADSQTLQYMVDHSISQRRFNMLLLSELAGLGIALAVGGVYGLISYIISSHQRDLGIRLALGAQRKHVFAALLRQILPFAAIGVVLGLLLSLLTKKLIADLLFESQRT
jgi:ABC-type antimicrobial peptide transport system permease subunit